MQEPRIKGEAVYNSGLPPARENGGADVSDATVKGRPTAPAFARSRAPANQRSSAAPTMPPAPAASNSVSDDRSFIASIPPNTVSAVPPGTSCNASTAAR